MKLTPADRVGCIAARSLWLTVVFAGVLAAVLGLAAPPASADNDAEDEFERKAVRVLCIFKDGDGQLQLGGTGSGFLVGDRRHVVTNNHVARSKPCLTGVAAVQAADGKPIVLKLLAYSEKNDLAVLEAERDIENKDPVTKLIAAKDISSRYEVFVVGFPGAVDARGNEATFRRPTTTRGIIGRKVESEDGVNMLQVDARTIGGNSGGPWLDGCGRLVGVHSQGSYTRIVTGVDRNGRPVYDRVPLGFSFAIQTDHLFPLLDQAKVGYDVVGQCSFVSRNAGSLGTALALVLGTGVFLRFTEPGRRLSSQLVSRVGLAPGGAAVPTEPAVIGLSGALRGVAVELSRGPLVIGRDGRVSNLVVPPERHAAGGDEISKRHCIVRFDAATRGFSIEDCWSTNGTFLASGERLVPGSARSVPAGTRFYLSSVDHMFELRDPAARSGADAQAGRS